MYRGRFAPSPTGPLHFGSLVAALASYLEARRHQGLWFLRIEDVDGPRCRPGAVESILSSLAAMGFRHDGEILFQSRRSALYQDAISRLGSRVFPCTCSRREIGDQPYPGTCRSAPAPGKPVRALRLRVDSTPITFADEIQGSFTANLMLDPGDFPLYRPDTRIYSYQLAVVCDDHAQQITHIVRGADLLDSTPRQIFLQKQLGYPTPHYAHIPVVAGPDGAKLSKQNLAPAINPSEAVALLVRALDFLNQSPPPDLTSRSLDAVWEWALSHWLLSRIPACYRIVSTHGE